MGPKFEAAETPPVNRAECAGYQVWRDAEAEQTPAKSGSLALISGTGQEIDVYLAERVSAEPVFSGGRPCTSMFGEGPVK